MKVRIGRAYSKDVWYANKIGEEFEVEIVNNFTYSTEIMGAKHHIDMFDCEVIPYEPVLIAEHPNKLKQAWDEGRLRTIEMLNAGNSTNPLINKDYCIALNPYGEIKKGNELHEPKPNNKLFQAAVAAMQGMLFQNFQGSNEDMSTIAWDIAEALINEGKKRGNL